MKLPLDAIRSITEGICYIAKLTVVPFELTIGVFTCPLTDVIQGGARELFVALVWLNERLKHASSCLS